MPRIKLPASVRKHIRKQKSEIRKNFSAPGEAGRKINELYLRFRRKPKVESKTPL